MIANYHTHTSRCGHAEGTDRQYAQAALDAGVRFLGFSDHTPYDFFDSQPRNRPMRMMPEELPEYVGSVRALREEYRGRMEIYAGVEAEYYPRYFSRLLELLRENGIEYMILGQHFLENEIDGSYAGIPTDREDVLDRYVSQTAEALQTGLFTYFAHPDLIRFTGDDRIYTRHIRRLCRAAKDAETPLEINLLGVLEDRHYPTPRFWQIAAEEGNQVILGRDAHKPEHFRQAACEEAALALAADLGLRPMEKVQLRPIL